MDKSYIIDKDSDIPIYKQLLSEIIRHIEISSLKHGDKLPVERELSQQLGISRGTVKKVYDELERHGFVKAIQGSGTFVSQIKSDTGEKNNAADMIDNLIDELVKIGFDYNEISSFFKIRLSNKKNGIKKISIAAVDCNGESLEIYKNQLSYIENLNYMGFLLKDVLEYSHPNEIFEDFDLIFTTTTHFNDLKEIFSGFEEKIIKAVVSPDKSTIFNISHLSNISESDIMEETGVLARSSRFIEIVASNLKYFGYFLKHENIMLADNLTVDGFKDFLVNKRALIMPPFYALMLNSNLYDLILDFNRHGGRIIIFNYTIEKGSLIYIEEKN